MGKPIVNRMSYEDESLVGSADCAALNGLSRNKHLHVCKALPGRARAATSHHQPALDGIAHLRTRSAIAP